MMNHPYASRLSALGDISLNRGVDHHHNGRAKDGCRIGEFCCKRVVSTPVSTQVASGVCKRISVIMLAGLVRACDKVATGPLHLLTCFAYASTLTPPPKATRPAARSLARRPYHCVPSAHGVAAPEAKARRAMSMASTDSSSSTTTVLFDDSAPDRRNTASMKWEKYPDGILPLWVADMDFRAPQCVIDALHSRAEHGVYGYTNAPQKLIDEVVSYLKRAHNWEIQPDWLVWVHGLVPALAVAARMAGREGDYVMTNTPIYPPFLWTPKTAGLGVQRVPLVREANGDEWAMDFETMEQMVTPTTKMFLLCNPHNPVGKVFSVAELSRLADFCNRHDLILVSDEIHCDLILEPSKPHVPLGTLNKHDVMRRSITLHAPSKTYNVPGLACAYAVIPDPELRARFKRAARGYVTEINCFGYEACYAAYKYGEPWRQELLQYLRGNRDLACDFITKHIPLLRVNHHHEATYLLWIDAKALSERLPRSSDPATFFRESARVGLSDGRDFGQPGYLRLNFGCPRATLHDALRRMQECIQEIL